MKRTALLLIDLQRDFLETTGRLRVAEEDARRVIKAANDLLNHAPTAGWKVIFVINQFRKNDWIGNFFRNQAAIEGSRGGEIDPRIGVPTGVPIFHKDRMDAFSNAGLVEAIRSGGIEELIMLGLMADACVRASTKSAMRAGLRVTVVSDGVACERQSAYQPSLRKLQKLGASLADSRNLIRSTVSMPAAADPGIEKAGFPA